MAHLTTEIPPKWGAWKLPHCTLLSVPQLESRGLVTQWVESSSQKVQNLEKKRFEFFWGAAFEIGNIVCGLFLKVFFLTFCSCSIQPTVRRSSSLNDFLLLHSSSRLLDVCVVAKIRIHFSSRHNLKILKSKSYLQNKSEEDLCSLCRRPHKSHKSIST
jgi:hypothetical protein